jgi:O-antigen/teichoic acid export membrane protein
LNNKDENSGIGRAVARGAFWVIISRFSVRFLGVVSTFVLTRLLMPADFGLIAIASFVIGLLGSLTAFGVAPALIQRKEINCEYYNTAWTLQILRGLVLALSLYFVAEPMALFYQKNELISVIKVFSLITFIGSCSSIYLVNFQRNLEFDREFIFNVKIKLIAFFSTILAAWLLKNYWALVIGTGISVTTSVIYSYIVFPAYPRFSLNKFYEIFSFSNWIFVYETLSYVSLKTEIILLGRLSTPTVVGIYDVSCEIATTPTSELTLPISRALFSGLSRLQSNPAEFSRVLLLTFSFIIAVGLPAGIGLSLIANPLITILFTADWQDMIPIVEIGAIYSIFRMLLGPSVSVFMAKGKVKFLAIVSALMLPVRILCIYFGWHYGELIGVALAVLFLAFIQSVTMLVSMSRLGILKFNELVYYSWRSFASTLLMAFSTKLVLNYCNNNFTLPFLEIIICTFSGILIYFVVHTGLWWLCGYPQGVESLVMKELNNRIFKKLARG